MSNPFLGSWRIVEMELWEREDIDMLGRGDIRFNRDRTGEFRFLAVQGGMDCWVAERDGRPIMEFSWIGYDEMDQTCGRGWAALDADGRLRGRLLFHLGDDSAFTATCQREVRNSLAHAGSTSRASASSIIGTPAAVCSKGRNEGSLDEFARCLGDHG